MRLPVRAPLPGAISISPPASRAPSGPRPPLAQYMAAPGGSPCGGSLGALRAPGGLTGSGPLGPLPWPWRLGLGSGAGLPPGLPYGLPTGRPCRAAWRLINVLTIGRAPANLAGLPWAGGLPYGPGGLRLGRGSLARLICQQHGNAGGAWANNMAPGAGSLGGPIAILSMSK